MLNKQSLNFYRAVLLIPFCFALMMMGGIFFASTYLHDRSEKKALLQKIPVSVDSAMRLNLESNADKLGALLKVLEGKVIFQASFARRDRPALLAASQDLFKRLKTDHDITHWYFMTPERQIFLRVHQPDRFGDIVERKTAIDAQHFNQVASGVELGIRGTFTLRVVLPWYDQKQYLLGYMELGMEVDKSLSNLQDLAGLNLFMLIEKKHLNRAKWEEGMRGLGHVPYWGQFPDVVLAGNTRHVDPNLLHYTRFAEGGQMQPSFEADILGERLVFNEVALHDAAGKAVGQWVVVNNFTEKYREQRQFVLRVLAALLVFGGASLWFAKYVVDRVYLRLTQTEIERDQFKIKSQLDGLTGLANQVAFYRQLEQHMQHCRVDGGVLAVLMIDIDYFKKVNDNYGHQAGDEVLRRVASLLQECTRPLDCAARYGGEEFGVMLYQMSLEGALHVAERIRICVEGYLFVAGGKELRVTVSIGVASFPLHADAPEGLVAEADQVLYAAKRAGRNCVLHVGAATPCAGPVQPDSR
jgi:diguanylate cyclase (GGDEF)-like protein